MKIVITTTPSPVHVNPMLGIARTLVNASQGALFGTASKVLVPPFARSLPARTRTWWIPSRSISASWSPRT
jgi:hypothetical protein